MKEFILSAPYNVSEQDRVNCPTNADVTRFIIRVCIISQHDGGMPRLDSRIWAKVQPKLNADKDIIELESIEYDWLFSQLQRWEKIPPRLAEWYWTLIDTLEDKNYAKRSPGETPTT